MSSISGGIKFAGLGSGVNFDDMIKQMKSQQSIQKTRLEYWKADWQKRYDAFGEILDSITTLNDTLKNFNNINKILSKAVSSSSTSVASAKAKADAPEGTHSLEVTQLATNSVVTNSTVFAGKDAPVSPDADTVFSYTYKGKTQNVKVPRGSSIQGMVDQINKDAKAAKVNITANLVKSGDGYVFQIQGNDTGVKNDLVVNSATTVPNFTPKNMRSTVSFANANSFMGDIFGPDGLKFSYGKAPDPLPEGKTIADYVTEFSIPPTIANSWQSTSRYKDGSDALKEPLNFTYGDKEYNFPTTNKQTFRTSTAYGADEPITESISFSYNGKDYDFEPDGKRTLSSVRDEIKAIGGKDISLSMVPEKDEKGVETGKKFLQVKANKVDVTVYEDDFYYENAKTPITEEIRIQTPGGKELVFPPENNRNLEEICHSINSDGELGLNAKAVKDDSGKVHLVVTKNQNLDEGIEIRSGGEANPTTISEVVSTINADTPTLGISAEMVKTEDGTMMLRLKGKEGVEFKPGTTEFPPLNPDGTPVDPDAATSPNFETAKRTMADVVKEINEQASGKGLFASIYTDAEGKSTLELRGNNPDDLTVPADKFEKKGPEINTWSKRAAQDAKYKLDGLEFEFSSTGNELVDVIPGLTVTLTDLGKTTLTTTTDTSKVQENVEAFVDGVNELLAKFSELTKFDKDKDVGEAVRESGGKSWETSFAPSQLALQKGGVLTGNYGVMLLNSQIKQVVSGNGLGFRVPQTKDDDIDKYYSLASIGIAMDADESSPTFGQLKIREPEFDEDGNRKDSDKGFKTLEEALEEDPLAVAQLLAGSDGVSDMPGVTYNNMLDGVTKAGTYDVSYKVGDDGAIGDVYIGGVRALRTDPESNTYSLQSGPGAGMSISITDTTPGDYNGTVRIKQGKVSQLTEMLDYQTRNDPPDLPNAKRGSLRVLQDNYRNIMDNIDKKIESEEKRLAQWEKRMVLRFSRLDTVLAQYNQRSQTISSEIAKMPAVE